MDFTMVIPVLIAFVLSVAAGPVVIPVLRRLKMDQTERDFLQPRLPASSARLPCRRWEA